MFGYLLAVVLQLTGVTGSDLRSRAFFDANNVKIGDPLVLTVDFLGQADFKDLHPPALSKAVNHKDWKIDDASAKTETYQDGRRLTYRVRPMREGVLWFPAIEFTYLDAEGNERIVKSNEIPVHAKAGAQVVVEGMGEDSSALPKPPPLLSDPGVELSDDEQFAWRKALASPTADKFAEFAFPAAKMNEATCAIKEGNWARAISVYSRLEWRIGQTPDIECGLIAALALRYDNPSVELPIWRQVMRPLLRFDWRLRIASVLGVLLALGVFFKLLARGIHAVAVFFFAIFLTATGADGETIETVTTNADGSVVHQRIIKDANGNSSFSFTSFSSNSSGSIRQGGKGVGKGIEPFSLFSEFDRFDPFGRRNRKREVRPPVKIVAALIPETETVTVGESFNLILSMEMPRYVTVPDGVRLVIAEQRSLAQTARGYSLAVTQSENNPTNLIHRMVFPMRANEPIENLHFSVAGEYAFTDDHSFFRETFPFSQPQQMAAFKATSVPAAGCPADFSGIVADNVELFEYCDLLKVGTNDVITITYRLKARGYVPNGYLPKGVAFEWARKDSQDPGVPTEIEYRRYMVADGIPATPKFEISYYDPKARKYRTRCVGGTALKYDIITED